MFHTCNSARAAVVSADDAQKTIVERIYLRHTTNPCLSACVCFLSVSFFCHAHPFSHAIFLSYSNNSSFYIDSIWCRATVFRLTNLYTSLKFNHLHCYFCCFLCLVTLFLISIARLLASSTTHPSQTSDKIDGFEVLRFNQIKNNVTS